MDSAMVFVLFLTGGFLGFVVYLAALSKRNKQENESAQPMPENASSNAGSRKNAA